MPAVTFDLFALNRVLEYHPEDLTVTVQAEIILAALGRTGETPPPMAPNRSTRPGADHHQPIVE